MQTNNKNYHKYWILLALAILFLGPVIAALSFYESGNNWIPSRINYGKLIQPLINIQQLKISQTDGEPLKNKQLLGKWSMLYVEPAQCQQNCEQVLYKMQQIRLALGKDINRVQRIVATFSNDKNHQLAEKIAANYQGTELVHIDKKQFEIYFKQQTTASFNTAGEIFIVDPRGNIMMRYSASEKPDGIYNDLRRLLKVSNIG